MKRPHKPTSIRGRRGAAKGLPFVFLALILALPVPAAERVVPESRQEVQLSYAPVVKEAIPAVVNIYARKVVEREGPTTLFDDPFFKRFFGDMFRGRPRERVQNSLGSGVIVRPEGVIVTNSHVINDAQEIVVVLSDRREYEAEVVVNDSRSDIAVLRVDAEESLPALQFTDSDQVAVGDIVLAVGNPFGVGQTVTSGIVSATARTNVGITDYQFFIQTDAAINPGNSGGALLDINGKLLGINTAIFSRSGGSHGIGFAIPANMVQSVVESALAEGKVVRPWLGIETQPVTQDIANSLGLDRPRGVIVNNIHPKSPLGEAGLENGDVIVGIDDFPIFTPAALDYRVATHGPEDEVTFHLLRDGREEPLTVTLKRPPEDPPRNITQLEGRNPLAGAVVANLSPALVQELGGDLPDEGVIVMKIARNSYAARLGLQPKDIIVAVNGTKVARVSGLQGALSRDSREWNIRINRGGRTLNVSVGL